MVVRSHINSAVSTTGGTLLTVLVNIRTEDIVETSVLAVVGAIVSYIMSLGLEWITNKIRRNK